MRTELKGINLSQDPAALLVNSKERRGPVSVSNVIDCGDYPSYNRLLRLCNQVHQNFTKSNRQGQRRSERFIIDCSRLTGS